MGSTRHCLPHSTMRAGHYTSPRLTCDARKQLAAGPCAAHPHATCPLAPCHARLARPTILSRRCQVSLAARAGEVRASCRTCTRCGGEGRGSLRLPPTLLFWLVDGSRARGSPAFCSCRPQARACPAQYLEEGAAARILADYAGRREASAQEGEAVGVAQRGHQAALLGRWGSGAHVGWSHLALQRL